MLKKHWIFTRWNLLDAKTTIYNNPVIKNPEGWNQHRMKLFDTYCLPSVMNQTCRNFTWLLSFAPETPKSIIDKYITMPLVKIIFQYPADYVRSLYPEVLKNGDWIITSRLDNDDMIAPGYIEAIQNQFDNYFMLVDTDGCQLDLKTGKRYDPARRSNNSPFISLIEQVGAQWGEITDPVKTVYWCSHSKMELHFPSIKIDKRLYTMIIHDKNICNKIVGNELRN
jgi:hypothetical protein